MVEIEDFKFHDKGKDFLNDKKHFHNGCYEILHIVSGSGNLMLGEKLYLLRPDCIFFINGRTAHCSVPEHPERYVRNKIVISAGLIEQVAALMDCKFLTQELFGCGGVCVQLDAGNAGRVNQLFLLSNEKLMKPGCDSKLCVVTGFLEMMRMAMESQSTSIPPVYNKMAEVLDYINHHLQQRIMLEDLCDRLHISRFYLCHTFKKATGMTIFDYILLMRLSKAKRLLQETQLPASEIAMQTGFSSFSYFSKKFREQEEITPLQYRKNYSSRER